ncbi:MAG: flagellar basal body P-ring formation chaperone FlgA, partial [Planctomycetota bacterium]
PGDARVLTRRDVELRLRAYGAGDALRIAGANRVMVRRTDAAPAPAAAGTRAAADGSASASTEPALDALPHTARHSAPRPAASEPPARRQAIDAMRLLAQRHLGGLLAAPDAQIAVTLEEITLPDSVLAHAAGLTITDAPNAYSRSRMDFTFVVEDAAGRPLGQASAVVEAEATLPVVMPRRPLDRGHLIGADDVFLEQAPLRQGARAYSRLDEVVGKRTRSSLRPGTPIRVGSIEVPPLVHRGQAVTVSAQVGRLVVRHRGEALQTGAAGDVIMVRNLNSRRQYPARVEPDGRMALVGLD